MTRITRLEVIDENGRSYLHKNDNNDVIYQLQDDGRTLKVFVNKMEPKSPAEEAFKIIYGEYPITGIADGSGWTFFQDGYNASKEEEYQPTPQEPEDDEWTIEKLQEKNWYVDAKTLLKSKEPEKEQKWDVVRESKKWCEEHPNENPLDWLKPHTPEQIEKSLKEAFVKAQQTEEWKETQKLIDEEDNDKNFKNSLDLIKEWGEKNKPPTLYEILMEWWINHLDMEQSDEEIVGGLVEILDKKFIPPSHNTNDYQWNNCLKIMRDKLR
jgi:hypothetical protein